MGQNFEDAINSITSGDALQRVIRFRESDSKNIDVKAIAKAIQSPKALQGLEIHFPFGFKAGNEIVKVLAEALKSGKAPQGLQLNLSDNRIYNDGAKALAEALKSGKAPQGLQLNLSGNIIYNDGVKALVNALESGKVPGDLILITYNKDIDKALAEAREKYLMMMTASACSVMSGITYNDQGESAALCQDVIGVIASYLHTSGELIANNVDKFWSMQSYLESPFSDEIGLDVKKLGLYLPVNNVTEAIPKALLAIATNKEISIMQRDKLAQELLELLKDIDGNNKAGVIDRLKELGVSFNDSRVEELSDECKEQDETTSANTNTCSSSWHSLFHKPQKEEESSSFYNKAANNSSIK